VSVGFIHPGAWLLAALFAVLIALYLWEQARRQVDVPSLLLWQVVPESVRRASRFRPDWLFVLQSVLLALLIGGLADPYFTDGSGGTAPMRTIFVVDCSASMQAREGRTTRFEMARAALARRIAALRPGHEAMLIAAAHHPQVVSPSSRDHSALLTRLAGLEPVDARASLDTALAVAQRAAAADDRPARIELFTDTPRDQLSARWRDGVGVFQLGETDDNLAIESVQVFQGRFQDHRTAHAYVAIRNFAHREAHGVLTLQLDDTVFSRSGFSLAPRSVGGFPLDDLPNPGVLRASLDIDDALAADNRAFAYVRPVRPVRVRVFTDDPTLEQQLRRIAGATANLTVEFFAADAYTVATGADLVIFHRVAPPLPADTPSLYVLPLPAEGNPFTVRGQPRDVSLLDWDVRHPVLRDLRPELPFPLRAVEDIDVPVWADRLLAARADGRDLALAFAGEADGQRRAVLAFDLARDDLLGADHVNLLLFFLNLLDWLTPSEDAVRIMHTGDVEIVDRLPVRTRHVVDPRNRTIELPADRSVAIDAAFAGEYRVAANGTAVRVFANFADSEESDIGRAKSGYIAPEPRTYRRSQAPTPPHGLARWLYAIAAALLLLEWMVARRNA
jgi:hypothetical protein